MKKTISELCVFFEPRLPDMRHSIWRILDILGVRISADPKDCDIGFLGDGSTKCTPPIFQNQLHIINSLALDISKTHVASCFAEVFGYSLAVDPYSYHGEIVEKSDLNYTHDGRVLKGPLTSVRPGCVYNLLVDNRVNEKTIKEYRVPVIGSQIPFVYERYRKLGKRFSNSDIKVLVAETKDVFQQQEVALLLAFCERMNLEFCELDVLRHNDGLNRLYVVDANRTPASPPRCLPFIQGHISMKRMARCFAEEFLLPLVQEGSSGFQCAELNYKQQFLRLCRWPAAVILALKRILNHKFCR